ncbi:hypothetical protein RFI_08390, partial [Reticulomyxa filosa]
NNLVIQWYSKSKPLKETCVYIQNITGILKGQKTEPFLKKPRKNLESGSFSIVYVVHANKGGSTMSLDLVAQSRLQCDLWVRSLEKLQQLCQHGPENSESDQRCEDKPKAAANSGQLNLTKVKFLNVGISKSEWFASQQNSEGSMDQTFDSNFKTSNEMLQISDLELLQNDFNAAMKSFTALEESLRQSESLFDKQDFIFDVLNELKQKLQKLDVEVHTTRNMKTCKKHIWSINTEVIALQEKASEFEGGQYVGGKVALRVVVIVRISPLKKKGKFSKSLIFFFCRMFGREKKKYIAS